MWKKTGGRDAIKRENKKTSEKRKKEKKERQWEIIH